jgi:hypothetical protein
MPYQSIRFSTLMSLLRGRLQNTRFWTDREIRGLLNEALKVFQVATLYWKTRLVLPTISGQVWYSLPDQPACQDAAGFLGFLMPIRVAYNSTPLEFCALTDLDNGLQDWQIQLAGVKGAPKRPQMWGLCGLNYLFLWPADPVGNQALQIDAAAHAPSFRHNGADDGEFCDIESGAVSQLLDYAQHVAQLKRGAGVLQSTMPQLQSFMRAVTLTNSLFRASSAWASNYAEQSDRRTRPRRVGDLTGRPTPARYR